MTGICFPDLISFDVIEYLVFYSGKQVGRERMGKGEF
jgi:hypothetical protein